MGVYLAASSFITHTPPCIMELPPAAVWATKQRMIERAICDERITLPVSSLREVDVVYTKLLPQLESSCMTEIKVAWRGCSLGNTLITFDLGGGEESE